MLEGKYLIQSPLSAAQDLLCVVDGPEQREDGHVPEGNLHGNEVSHVVFHGPLRLHAKNSRRGNGQYTSKANILF